MDIDKLEAGRELDALVAEKVMGWRNCSVSEDSIADKNGEWHKMYIKYGIGEPPDLDQSCWYTQKFIPLFSNNITAVWEVVEKLSEHCIVRISNGDGDSRDCDILPFVIDTYNLGHASADAWALAICRAALKAVED